MRLSGYTPARLTRPTVVFRPVMPHSDAGIRTEPLVSVPERDRHETGRNGDRRTARRATRHVRFVVAPRVARCAGVVVDPDPAVRELHRVRLADQHHSRVAQPPHDGRVGCRRRCRRADGCRRRWPRPLTSNRSFAAYGMPCSGPRDSPRANSRSACRGLGERTIPRDVDERVVALVVLVDAVESCARPTRPATALAGAAVRTTRSARDRATRSSVERRRRLRLVGPGRAVRLGTSRSWRGISRRRRT